MRRQPFVVIDVAEDRIRRSGYESSALEVTRHRVHSLLFAQFRGNGVSLFRRVVVELGQLLTMLRNVCVAA